MPNRDHEDSQYNRHEGRFESRDDRHWQEHSPRGPRAGEPRGEEFRRDFAAEQGRAHYEGGRPEREGERFQRPGFAQDRGFGQRDEGAPRGSLQSPSWYDERQNAQHFGHSEWNRPQGFGPQGPQAGQGMYGQGNQGSYGGHAPDWSRSGGGYGRSDAGRGQSAYGGREGSHSQRDQGQMHSGDAGMSHQDESFGQQLRHAGQQMARSVKRVFRGPKGYKRSDDRLREDVSDRLALQDHVDPSDIEVSVSNGEVTLTGTVQTRREKFVAEEIADDVSGVTDVHNQLRVRREDGQRSLGATAAASLGLSAENSSGTSSAGPSAESALRNRNARS